MANSIAHRLPGLIVLVCVAAPASVSLAAPSKPDSKGAPGLGTEPLATALVQFYREFQKDRDLEAFQKKVSARYVPATLERALAMGTVEARQAAVLALSLVADFSSHDAVGKALRDPDPVVSRLAAHACWPVWFRGDTPDNNRRLQEVADRINVAKGRDQLQATVEQATALIKDAPKFAEAYNQRAIAHYIAQDFRKSIEDCERAVKLNRYHFGALSGMGQCYQSLGDTARALDAYRRALKANPNMDGIREAIYELEHTEGRK